MRIFWTGVALAASFTAAAETRTPQEGSGGEIAQLGVRGTPTLDLPRELPRPAEVPVAEAPAIAEPAPDREVPALTANEEIGLLQEKIDPLTEQYGETKTDFGALKRMKFSGYIQALFQDLESSKSGVDEKGTSLVKDGFSIRRGRFKATYLGDFSRYVLSIDATGKGIALKDAEVHLVEPWTKHKLELVVGQMLYPFGFEVLLQSSAVREMPERARITRALLAGERDRGAKLVANVKWLRLQAGVFDGNGTDAKGLGSDDDRHKDVIGRAGVDFKWIAAGLSGWLGQAIEPGIGGAAGKQHDRSRVGADLAIYLDLVPIGATSLRGEYLTGRTYLKDGVEKYGLGAEGFYAQLNQNIGLREMVSLRFDHFDPDTDTAEKSDRAEASKPASSNTVDTVAVAWSHFWDDTVRLTAAWEIVRTKVVDGAKDPADDLLTLQAIARF